MVSHQFVYRLIHQQSFDYRSIHQKFFIPALATELNARSTRNNTVQSIMINKMTATNLKLHICLASETELPWAQYFIYKARLIVKLRKRIGVNL
jgi:hypothetical protein